MGSLVTKNVSIALLVHDLRNLLSVINLCAESIYEKVPRGQADQEFADLRRSIEDATDLSLRLLPAGEGETVGKVHGGRVLRVALHGNLERIWEEQTSCRLTRRIDIDGLSNSTKVNVLNFPHAHTR